MVLNNGTVIVAPATLEGAPPPGRYDPARKLFVNPDADLASPARLNGINAGAGARVTLAFVTRHVRRVKGRRTVSTQLTRRRTVRYGTPTRLCARVVTPAGVPIIGARIWRAVSVAGGPWKIAGKPLMTSKTGRASVKLAARSP